MAVLEAQARPVTADLDWRQLYDSLRPRATGLLKRYRIPAQDAEDVLHDALLLFLSKKPRVEDPLQWILGTLKRRCSMYWRERRRRLYRATEASLLEALTDPVAPNQHNAAHRYDLERALGRLPDSPRRVLETRYLEDRTPAETAQRLGYRASGIYKVIDRGLDRLGREFNPKGRPTEKR